MNRLSILLIAFFLCGASLFTVSQIDATGAKCTNSRQTEYSPATPGILSSEDSLLAESISRGKKVYMSNCLSCHMTNGEGIQGAFPPLAKSDYLMADSIRAIQITLYGKIEAIMVNGVKYQSPGHSFSHLSDEQIADVMNYIRNSWGNNGALIVPEQVATKRKEK